MVNKGYKCSNYEYKSCLHSLSNSNTILENIQPFIRLRVPEQVRESKVRFDQEVHK